MMKRCEVMLGLDATRASLLGGGAYELGGLGWDGIGSGVESGGSR